MALPLAMGDSVIGEELMGDSLIDEEEPGLLELVVSLLPQAAMPRGRDSARATRAMRVVRLWFLMRGLLARRSVDTRGSVCRAARIGHGPKLSVGRLLVDDDDDGVQALGARGEGVEAFGRLDGALAVCRADGELVSARVASHDMDHCRQ